MTARIAAVLLLLLAACSAALRRYLREIDKLPTKSLICAIPVALQRDPHGPGLAAMLSVQGREAVVTSGRYERWRLADGVRRTHIIDPATGLPAAGLDSVTVLHRDAALADAAATALLVAGPAGLVAVKEAVAKG